MEMVDSPASLQFARACGADYVQGYLFGKPHADIGVFERICRAILFRACSDGVAAAGRQSALTRVPTPYSVNSSSSSACGTRPSMMTAPSTPPAHRLEAGLDLRDHAAADGAVGDVAARLARRHLRDQLALLVEHALDVGQHQQPLRADRGGDGAGGGIGVDVERLAARAACRSARSPG